MRNNKKGFTIVELVIVIAVIAILAAVLIPTFVSITRKANQSADIQAVRQMNTLLAIGDAEGGYDDIADVIFALDQEKIDLEDYKPLSKDTYFYWVKSENRIVYTDASDNVIFPEDLKDVIKEGWYSLSGEVPTDDGWTEKVENNVLSVGSAAQFVDFLNKYSDGNNTAEAVTEIKLTADIDLKGSAANFKTVTGTLTFDGNGKSIKNARVDTNTVTGDKKTTSSDGSYYYGLFAHVKSGATVTVKNLNINGVSIGDTNVYNSAGLGVITGLVASGATLNIENVTIDNAFVFGGSKAGSLVGFSNGTVKVDNVTVTNTRVESAWNAAKVVGYVTGSLNVTNSNFAGVTVSYSEDWAKKLAEENVQKDGKLDVDVTKTETRDGYVWVFRGTKNAYYPTATDKNCWASSANGQIAADGK